MAKQSDVADSLVEEVALRLMPCTHMAIWAGVRARLKNDLEPAVVYRSLANNPKLKRDPQTTLWDRA